MKLLLAAVFTLGLTACASPGVEQYRAEQPVLDLKTYLNGTLDAWGLGYEDLAASNPRIIWAAGSYLGPQGPDRALLARTVGEGVVVELADGVAVGHRVDLVVGDALERGREQFR